LTRGAAAGLAGLFIGAGLALLVDRFDVKIRSRRDAEDLFGVPVLAGVPKLGRRSRRAGSQIVTLARPFSAAADAYRRLRTTVELMLLPAPDRLHTNGSSGNGAGTAAPETPIVILITSSHAGEGKSTVVANLAGAFSEAGERVLVCDCDFRRPALHSFLRPTEVRTLASVLETDARPRLDTVVTSTVLRNVWLLRAADVKERVANPTGLLTAQRTLIEQARNHADVILVDTAPLLSANDANDLLPIADAVLVVASSGATRRDEALQVRERLDLVAAPFMGVVLLGASENGSREYYDEKRTGGDVSADEGVAFASGPPRRPARAPERAPDAPESRSTVTAAAAASKARSSVPDPIEKIDVRESVADQPVSSGLPEHSSDNARRARRSAPPRPSEALGVSRLWRRP
jgi:capsular exopolysaccharide synthesis family protein